MKSASSAGRSPPDAAPPVKVVRSYVSVCFTLRLRYQLSPSPQARAWLAERDTEWQHWQQTQRRRQELATQLVQQQERADAAQTQAIHWAEQAAQRRAAAADAMAESGDERHQNQRDHR